MKKKTYIRFGYECTSSFYKFIAEFEYIQKLIQKNMLLDENITNDLRFNWNQFFISKMN